MSTHSTPRFTTVPEQIKIIHELLAHVNVGGELFIHLASLTAGPDVYGSHPFTQKTIVVPGMDRRLLEVFEIAMRQYGIRVERPQLGVRQSDSLVSHRAGVPRVVTVNLIAHCHLDMDHPVNLEALVAREDSYLSSVATLWMIILNPEYARWLAMQQVEYKYILLPGLTQRHLFGTPDEELLLLAITITQQGFAFRWLAPTLVPLGSVSPVVVADDSSPHLVAKLASDEESSEGE